MNQLSLTPEQKARITHVIVLEDKGQDMHRLYIDNGGVVVCCDFNSEIYTGALINFKSVVKGFPLHLMLPNESAFFTYHKLIVDQVVPL